MQSRGPEYFQQTIKRALVFGGQSGIGRALLNKLGTLFPEAELMATHRCRETPDLPEWSADHKGSFSWFFFDSQPQQESKPQSRPQDAPLLQDTPLLQDALLVQNSLAAMDGPLDLVFYCIGFLHGEGQPERRLDDIDFSFFNQSMTINAYGALRAAQIIAPYLSQDDPSAFVTLSAKIGSISDNRLGGWYSYRCSKAALNMGLKTLSIEWKRKKKKTLVLSIHPGTTDTPLSQPFYGKTRYKIHSPQETANNIWSVLQNRTIADSGKFFSWDNTELTY